MRYIKFILVSLLLNLYSVAFASTVEKNTILYSLKDSTELFFDIYSHGNNTFETQPCIIFVFGGGFKEGTRDDSLYTNYFHFFAQKGFKVVSIDYRLGMKNQKAPSLFNNKPIQQAISLAVSDLFSATKFIIDNSEELNIDTNRIIISGSSAGAITVLQAEYEKRNNMPSANLLSKDFQYAGVLSFAGSIFSTQGTPKYKVAPAPTLFFHGSADKLVPYNKIRFFSKGMFGSKPLAKQFKKNKYPYAFYTMKDIGHEVSEYPMNDFLIEIDNFIQRFIIEKNQWLLDTTLKDMDRYSNKSDTPKSYFD